MARFDGATVNFDGISVNGGSISFSRIEGSAGEVSFRGAILLDGHINFSGAQLSGSCQIRFDDFEIRAGKLSFVNADVAQNASVTFASTKVNGGEIDCGATICAGDGKVILSDVSCTGDGLMMLDDALLAKHTYNGLFGSGGPPEINPPPKRWTTP